MQTNKYKVINKSNYTGENKISNKCDLKVELKEGTQTNYKHKPGVGGRIRAKA